MVTCGISDSFESLSPTSGQITYVLLSRSPLAFPLAGIGSSDLHVLCTPPAFVLSQDQTLRQKIRPSFRTVLLKLRVRSKNQRNLAWRSCHSSAVKDRAPTSQWNTAYGRDADVHHTHPRSAPSIKRAMRSPSYAWISASAASAPMWSSPTTRPSASRSGWNMRFALPSRLVPSRWDHLTTASPADHGIPLA